MSAQDVDILELFKEVALEVTKKTFPDMTPDAPLAELGIDSIASFEIIGKIEDRLGVRVADEKLSEIMTVRDLAEALKSARPQA